MAQNYEVGGPYASDLEEPRGAGWVVFATVMLGFTAIFNFFEGIAAISSAHVYVGDAHYVFSDLKTWGWIVLIISILQGLAALYLLTGSEWARWFGIASASISALGQLTFAPAYPLWSLAMFAADILIIYGLAVYGGSRLRRA